MTSKRERITFTDAFKKQMVQLFNAGKTRSEIIKEYDQSPTAFDSWVRRINATGSAKECDNRSQVELDIIILRKENLRLKMENDILKQAALIFAQK